MSATQQTNLNTMDAARERVFATEELFEGILSLLPLKTFFYIRKVSKRWASGINGSVDLQQRMFLRPWDKPELWTLIFLNEGDSKWQRVKGPQDDGRSITPVPPIRCCKIT